MIQKLSHTPIFVDDYDRALDFYVGKLGMEVRSDMAMPGGTFRWLTIAPKGQDIEIVLMKLDSVPNLGPGDVEAIRGLQRRGALSAGVLATDDCRRSYEELSAKGVEFMSPPKEEFYAIEALLKDPFGNWFSMTQRK
jgi:catechol 2,3-dioxygenase-like lactoylglutathione lyase family enzyme